MSIYISLFISMTLIFFIPSCEQEPDPRESNKYNAYFVYPIDPINKNISNKTYVGTVTGLSSCKYVVSKHYNDRRRLVKGQWDYLCCLNTKGDACAAKHRYEGY